MKISNRLSALPGFCTCDEWHIGPFCQFDFRIPPTLFYVGDVGSNGICDLERNSMEDCMMATCRGNGFLPDAVCIIKQLDVRNRFQLAHLSLFALKFDFFARILMKKKRERSTCTSILRFFVDSYIFSFLGFHNRFI